MGYISHGRLWFAMTCQLRLANTKGLREIAAFSFIRENIIMESMKKIQHDFRHNPRYLKLQKPLEAANVCDAARGSAQGRFEVISYRQGLLTLAVSNSSEAGNLQMESQKIIDEINKKIGQDKVQNIRFKIR